MFFAFMSLNLNKMWEQDFGKLFKILEQQNANRSIFSTILQNIYITKENYLNS